MEGGDLPTGSGSARRHVPTRPADLGASARRDAPTRHADIAVARGRKLSPPCSAKPSALHGGTLRLARRESPPYMRQSKAESCQKYGGGLFEVRRRVGNGRSEGCSDTVGEFDWSDEKAPDLLGFFGRPTRRLRWTDRGTSVGQLCRLGLPTSPPPAGGNSNCRGACLFCRAVPKVSIG